MNKREFVLAGGAVVLAGGARSATALAAVGPAVTGAGRLADWQRCVGQRFDLMGNGVTSALLLQRVDRRDSDARTEQFTLVFASASAGAAPTAGTQVLRQQDGRLLALYFESAGTAEAGAALLRADCCHLA